MEQFHELDGCSNRAYISQTQCPPIVRHRPSPVAFNCFEKQKHHQQQQQRRRRIGFTKAPQYLGGFLDLVDLKASFAPASAPHYFLVRRAHRHCSSHIIISLTIDDYDDDNNNISLTTPAKTSSSSWRMFITFRV